MAPQMSYKHSGVKEAARKDETGMETWSDFKYSATQLDLAGVKFQAGNLEDLFDIKFSKDRRYCFRVCKRGCFEIPPFRVDDYTATFLRNLIAFEQSCIGIKDRKFTSHAFLMDKLINSPEDVGLLEEVGIIRNGLGSTEEEFLVFNNICKNVSPNDSSFQEPCKEVSNYCKQSWPKFAAKLRRDYFGSPWTIISIIAAFFLFALTLLQTIYTLLSYY
ncbi:UPF0481 protein At3g47200-like [Cornus florida]|uniref:UPF0481 protein At3g47200-like n=1 Tax=Cornus florida TaxID=4283 RepID=UPI00289EA049|nr:UPF0481 protein At3g47200-like [Cornus florida]